MSTIKVIQVVPYDEKWPSIFATESQIIKNHLKNDLIALHHIGSTSVPGLCAKPIIDMVAEVKNGNESISKLQEINYVFKGEFNIPLKWFFAKKAHDIKFNLHVFEKDHPEVELNIKFRDYLINNPQALQKYALIKQELLQNESSFNKNNSIFTGYNLGKDSLIRELIKASGFNRLRMTKTTHYIELESAKKFRQQYFSAPDIDASILEDSPEHVHFTFYQGVEIIGYAHVQLLQNKKAILKIFVLDELFKNKECESYFSQAIERWFEKHNLNR